MINVNKDILGLIFSYLDPISQSHCKRVSKLFNTTIINSSNSFENSFGKKIALSNFTSKTSINIFSGKSNFIFSKLLPSRSSKKYLVCGFDSLPTGELIIAISPRDFNKTTKIYVKDIKDAELPHRLIEEINGLSVSNILLVDHTSYMIAKHGNQGVEISINTLSENQSLFTKKLDFSKKASEFSRQWGGALIHKKNNSTNLIYAFEETLYSTNVEGKKEDISRKIIQEYGVTCLTKNEPKELLVVAVDFVQAKSAAPFITLFDIHTLEPLSNYSLATLDLTSWELGSFNQFISTTSHLTTTATEINGVKSSKIVTVNYTSLQSNTLKLTFKASENTDLIHLQQYKNILVAATNKWTTFYEIESMIPLKKIKTEGLEFFKLNENTFQWLDSKAQLRQYTL